MLSLTFELFVNYNLMRFICKIITISQLFSRVGEHVGGDECNYKIAYKFKIMVCLPENFILKAVYIFTFNLLISLSYM